MVSRSSSLSFQGSVRIASESVLSRADEYHYSIQWDLIGHALNRPSQLNMRGTAPSGGIFAPTLRYHAEEETFYMITTFFDILSPPDVSPISGVLPSSLIFLT